jgi:hypothetical protein
MRRFFVQQYYLKIFSTYKKLHLYFFGKRILAKEYVQKASSKILMKLKP